MRISLRNVLLVFVVILVGVSGCKLFGKDSSKSDPVSLIPRDVSVIGSIDIEKIQAIEIFKEAIKESESSEQYALFAKAGLATENIKRVSYGVDAAKAVTGGEPGVIVVVEVSVPLVEQNIVQVLEQEKVIVNKETIGDHTAYELKVPGPQSSFLLAVINDNLLVVGSADLVRKAIKLAGGEGEAVTGNSELMALCGNGSLPDLLWVGGILPKEMMKKLGEKGGPGAAGPIRPDQISSVFLSINYSTGEGLSIAVKATCESEDVAAKAVPELQKLKGFAMMVGIQPDGISITQDGSVIGVSVVLSDEFLKSMSEQLKQKFGGMIMPTQQP